MTPAIAAFSSICAEDAVWVTQYLAEVERLGLPFAMHLDRCGGTDLKHRFLDHPLCLGVTERNDPAVEFNETHKQAPFDLVVKAGFRWAMAWDVDETYERDAPRLLAEIAGLAADYVSVRWKNLWGTPEWVRIDGPFSGGHRVKFYNLTRQRWAFTHPITNGAKAVDGRGRPLHHNLHKHHEGIVRADHPLVCLHHGLMTRELRLLHKERWDRIYTTAVGGNPYGLWNFALDEEHFPPVLSPNEWL